MLEEAPFGVTAKEILTKRDESRKVNHIIWRKMMELYSEIVQKSPKKGGWHQKTSLDVGHQENALAPLQCRLDLPCLQTMPPILRDESLRGQVLQPLGRDA